MNAVRAGASFRYPISLAHAATAGRSSAGYFVVLIVHATSADTCKSYELSPRRGMAGIGSVSCGARCNHWRAQTVLLPHGVSQGTKKCSNDC